MVGTLLCLSFPTYCKDSAQEKYPAAHEVICLK